MNTRTVLLFLLSLQSFSSVHAEHYKFALCPKFVNNSFFDVSRDGCVDRAAQLTALNDQDTVECIYVGHDIHGEFGDLQAQAILEALDEQPDIDGLSISVTEADKLVPVYEAAKAKGIPIVTFDSDDPDSGRVAYIGTDNFFMGSQIAKVLQKLAPAGGKYAILSSEAPNLEARAAGIQSVLEPDPVWVPYLEETAGVVSYQGNNTLGIIRMKETLEEHPDLDAFLMVTSVAMGYDSWGPFVIDHPNQLFICADDGEWQLRYLKVNKVHGLVGQSVYEMGVKTADTLYELIKNPYYHEVPDFVGTNVIEHLVVPLVLPKYDLQENELPVWAVVIGLTLFVTVSVTSMLFSLWTLLNRTIRVVQMAQPEFLLMIAFGCMVLASTLIPLSMEHVNEVGSSAICMASPWLLCLGFSISFAALFAKTRRINNVIEASRSFRRASITQVDAAKPLWALLLVNIIVLTVWTVVDPLLYTRKDAPGTDEWNRVIETYGACESTDSALPYVLVLAILNVGVLLLANYEAYRARNLDSEFSETQYIAIAMASLLQACVIGMPVILLVQDNPLALYLTMGCMLFFVCIAILCLIFVPKMQAAIKTGSGSRPSLTTWNGKSQKFGNSSAFPHALSDTNGQNAVQDTAKTRIAPKDNASSGNNNSSLQPSNGISGKSVENPQVENSTAKSSTSGSNRTLSDH